MPLTVAIPRETEPFEARVAVTPETVKKLVAVGCNLIIEKGAGLAAAYPDTAYTQAGAKLASSLPDTLKSADVVLCVKASVTYPRLMKKGAALIGLMHPHASPALLKEAADAGITAMAMELVPRITRAQAMDVLSSQANLAGYRAVLEACHYYQRAFPMMMTAAGTIAPARVFVMGAGVAGLQAIATARRLGAVVSATDVRLAAKEQVASLGASFIMVEDDETRAAETAGGYAKEMSEAYKKKQATLIAETIAKQDIVITTALIPGKKAPILVDESMLKSMKPGSVIVDMAVEQGGNVAGSKYGEVVIAHGVTIVGRANLPAALATDASALYSRNLYNLLLLLIDKQSAALAIHLEDEIIASITLTRNGQIIHPQYGGQADSIKTKTVKNSDTPEKAKQSRTKSAPKKAASKTSVKGV